MNYIILFSAKAFASLLLATLPLILVPLYGKETAGSFSYYFSLTVLLGAISRSGVDIDMIKRAQFFTPLRKLHSTYTTSCVIVIIINTLALTAITGFIGLPVDWKVGASAILFSLSTTTSTLLYNKDRYISGALGIIVIWAVLLAALFINKENAVNALLAATATSATVTFYAYIKANNLPPPSISKKIILTIKKIYKTLPGYFLIGTIPIAYTHIGVFIAGFSYSPQTIADYMIANRGGFIVSFIFLSLNQYVSSRISIIHRSSPKSALEHYSKKINGFFFLISLLVFVISFYFAPYYLSFFSATSSETHEALIYFLTGALINAATGCVGGLLTMTGHQKSMSKYLLISFLTYSITSLLLVKYSGIIGLAQAYLISTIIQNTLATLKVVKAHGFFPFPLPRINKA